VAPSQAMGNGEFAARSLIKAARELRVSYEVVLETARLGRLPVVNFAAGGIATPADVC
jgi:pyridoxal 5'-phosphate synthase pdxS subunit